MTHDQTAPELVYAGPIQQAVDDWLLMQHKAQAWDRLRQLAEASTDPAAPLVLGLMNQLETP